MPLGRVTDREQWTFRGGSLLRRILVCVVGEIITSLGIAVLLIGHAGVDPYTAFLQGVAHLSGLSFAAVVPIVNILLLVVVIPFDRTIFGLGTVLNFTMVGVLVDLFQAVCADHVTVTYTIPGMLVCLLIGMGLFSLGVSMYITCDLGQGPYDGIAPAINRERPRVSYRAFRVTQDILAIALALVLTGFDLSLGIVAVGTIVMGFFLGPIIGLCNTRISSRLVGAPRAPTAVGASGGSGP